MLRSVVFSWKLFLPSSLELLLPAYKTHPLVANCLYSIAKNRFLVEKVLILEHVHHTYKLQSFPSTPSPKLLYPSPTLREPKGFLPSIAWGHWPKSSGDCDSPFFSNCTYLENNKDFYFISSRLSCHWFVSRMEWKMLSGPGSCTAVLMKGCPAFTLYCTIHHLFNDDLSALSFCLAVVQNTRKLLGS